MKTKFVIPVLAAGFILTLFVFFVVTMTPGTRSDTTDWAMYVMHARNLVTGVPYTATGYIYQPESTTEIGANAYPSGLPLMLAPIYATRGYDLNLFKLLNSAFLALSLWPIYLLARRSLSQLSSLVIILALGFSFLYLTNYNLIQSDAPYQLASMSVLVFLLRIYDKRRNETNPWLWGFLAALAITAAYLIRPFGLALLIGVCSFEILRNRRITAFSIATSVFFLPVVFLNNWLFHVDGAYRSQFIFTIKSITHHAFEYSSLLSYAFANPLSHRFRYAMWALTLIPAAFGFFNRIRKGLGVTELYLFVLFAVECVYWAAIARYLLPIMPIFLIYTFEGFQAIMERVPKRLVFPLKAAAAILLLLAPAANAVLFRPDPTDTLVTAPTFEQLCSVVRNQTEKNSLIVFWNPRVLTLSTGRFTSGWREDKPGAMIQYLDHVHPNYVIVDNRSSLDRESLIPLVATSPSRFSPIFENGQFRLMRWIPDANRPGSE